MTMVKERPILFTGDMVRAILDGRKSQTRRVIMPQPTYRENAGFCLKGQCYGLGFSPKETQLNFIRICCPYVQGDRLWVRETWWHPEPYSYGSTPSGEELKCPRMVSRHAPVHYAADGEPPNIPNTHYPRGLRNGAYSAPDPWAIWTKRPSIHMPRWASRILLEITEVRVERVQEIDAMECMYEGIEISQVDDAGPFPVGPTEASGWYRTEYRKLWDSLNGKKYPWQSNPWVWTISFERLEIESPQCGGSGYQ
jgi:hypothetical protein